MGPWRLLSLGRRHSVLNNRATGGTPRQEETGQDGARKADRQVTMDGKTTPTQNHRKRSRRRKRTLTIIVSCVRMDHTACGQ